VKIPGSGLTKLLRPSESSQRYLVKDAKQIHEVKADRFQVDHARAEAAHVDPAAWPEAARRELTAHLEKLGLDPSVDHPLAELRAAELKVGAAMDPRVDQAKMESAVRRALHASELEPTPQAALLGFSRLIDAKHFLDGESISALAAAATEPPSGVDQLLEAINHGPDLKPIGDDEHAWSRPKTKTELVASLVRHLVMGDGASRQLQLTPELAQWLEDVLEAHRPGGFRYAMGGAGAFGANLASSLPNLDTSFFSKDPLPEKIGQTFTSRVSVTGKDGEVRSTSDASDSRGTRINYALEYEGGVDLSVAGRSKLMIEGELTELKTTKGSRIICSTPEPFESGFGDMSDDALAKVARERDVCFFAGLHYFTKADPKVGAEKAAHLGAQLDVMKQANPNLVRHYQYVVPKVEANELPVMKALAGHLDSMSLNSVEVSALLHRLDAGGAADWKHDPTPPREEAERLDRMCEGADKLLDSMQLSRVHLHGYDGDLLVTTGEIDPERQILAHMKARQIASMKTTNETGEIRSADDMWPVAPTVKGQGLAAVEQFADEMQRRHGLTDTERDQVAERWWFKDEASGRTYVFAPSRGIHDRTGGTVSLGDTIDLSALLFERSASGPDGVGRGKKLMHPSSFQ
jgi:ADP-dependent phosphofructokinase/glucokinase